MIVIVTCSTLNEQKIEKIIQQIKRCFIITSILFIVIGLFTSIQLEARVEYDEDTRIYTVTNDAGATEYKVDALRSDTWGNFVLKMAMWLYGTGLGTVGSSGAFTIDTKAEYWQIFTRLYEIVSPIGIGLALLWVLIEIIERTTVEQLSGEFVVKMGIRFIIASVVIDSASNAAAAFVEFGNSLFTSFTEAINETIGGSVQDDVFVSIYNAIENTNVFGCIAYALDMLLPAMGMVVFLLVAYILLFGRLLEIGIRFVFFPIGASDFFTHGMHSAGFIYCKKFLAVCCTGAAMYVVLLVGTTVQAAGPFNDAIPGLGGVNNLIVFGATIGMMVKSKTIMEDVFGR